MLKTNPTKKKVQIEGIKKPKIFKKCIKKKKKKAYQPSKSQTSYNKHNGWANFKTVSCTIHIMHTNFNKNPIRALEKDPTFHNGNHNKYTKNNEYIYIYQFLAKLNGWVLIATFLALATPTEHTNPLKPWLPHFTPYFHCS